MREWDFELETLDEKQFLRCLGYPADATPNQELMSILRSRASEAQRLARICGTYTLMPIMHVENDLIFTQVGSIKSRQLAGVASQANQMAFCLVTAGEALDQKIESITDLLEACVWDAAGTVLVEKGVDLLLAKIREEQGLATSLPFSPGYCDWELNGQHTVFSAFAQRPLGIQVLPESLMMVPQKSISFVACLGVEDKGQNPCRHCTLKNCFMRR